MHQIENRMCHFSKQNRLGCRSARITKNKGICVDSTFDPTIILPFSIDSLTTGDSEIVDDTSKYVQKIKKQRQKIEKLTDKFQQQKKCITELEEYVKELELKISQANSKIEELSNKLRDIDTHKRQDHQRGLSISKLLRQCSDTQKQCLNLKLEVEDGKGKIRKLERAFIKAAKEKEKIQKEKEDVNELKRLNEMRMIQCEEERQKMKANFNHRIEQLQRQLNELRVSKLRRGEADLIKGFRATCRSQNRDYERIAIERRTQIDKIDRLFRSLDNRNK